MTIEALRSIDSIVYNKDEVSDDERNFKVGAYPEILWESGESYKSNQRHQFFGKQRGICGDYGSFRIRQDYAAQLYFYD